MATVESNWASAPSVTQLGYLGFGVSNMGEWREFVHLRQYRLPYRVTLLAVFFLTVVFDLTVAVEVGLIAACVLYALDVLWLRSGITPIGESVPFGVRTLTESPTSA